MDLRQHFRQLHTAPFVIPNPWDIGSARILASMGFSALATTSHGFANTLGRADGSVTRDEAIAHAKLIQESATLPINGDLENGFGNEPADAGQTVADALTAGIAGCSIEDYGDGKIYPIELATDRIRAAAEANHKGDAPLMLTARAENFIRGNPNLADTIERLQAFQSAGADVLYAPGLTQIEDIRTVVQAVDRPVNVLIMPGGPTVPEIFEAGAIRISTGSAISMAAQSAMVEAAKELLGPGTQTFWTNALPNMPVVNEALSKTS